MNRVLVVLCSLLLLSCNSSHHKQEAERTPASTTYVNQYDGKLGQYLAQDPFSRDGYDHNQDDSYTNRHFQIGKSLSKEQEIKELAGREIWFKSAPNERFHTYYFPQKLNSPIAWYKILQAERRDKRFLNYGLINDPDCCVPGETCKEKGLKDKRFTYHGQEPTMDDTFGWEYCAGDDVLLDNLKIVDALKRKQAWRDPACDHPIVEAADALDKQPRESRCELAFGNPTGAVGYRKFPNPRFNLARWNKIGGWEGYEKRMTEKRKIGESETKLEGAIDASIEPPFRIGKSCASCHAAFDPLNPPKDIANPSWKNIKGETGNQYINISSVLGSGAKENSIEYQMFVHARAGTVDTSAVPNDFVNNPGTINALINIDQRPKFDEKVTRWDNVASCNPGPDCQVIKYKNGGTKYWQFKRGKQMQVMHILKGGEDSVGADLAAQRVYVNIGMCAEQCWVNHLNNLRELDPAQRGYGQTPFNIRQCRQDCASWRANEDRIGDVFDYILSRRPTDLKDATLKGKDFKAVPGPARELELAKFLDERYGGSGLVEQGRQVFAQNCAGCHSSQNPNKNDVPGDSVSLDAEFFAKTTLKSGEILRADWLGNDKSSPVDLVGTYKCRTLHSNHMKGHVWEEFASDTYFGKKSNLTGIRSEKQAGGRGFYRNISLLNLWAHAPFMHNNSVGPEICGTDSNVAFNPWRSTIDGKQLETKTKYTCDMLFNPSAEARLVLFEKSVDELLTPSQERRKKISLTDVPIRLPLAMSLNLFKTAEPLFVEFPAGIEVTKLASFDIKAFTADLNGAVPVYQNYVAADVLKDEAKRTAGKKAAWDEFYKYWLGRMNGDATAAKVMAETALGTFQSFRGLMALDAKTKTAAYLKQFAAGENQRLYAYLRYYSNCDAYQENGGHDFGTVTSANGTALSDDEKKALKAFLATL